MTLPDLPPRVRIHTAQFEQWEVSPSDRPAFFVLAQQQAPNRPWTCVAPQRRSASGGAVGYGQSACEAINRALRTAGWETDS